MTRMSEGLVALWSYQFVLHTGEIVDDPLSNDCFFVGSEDKAFEEGLRHVKYYEKKNPDHRVIKLIKNME